MTAPPGWEPVIGLEIHVQLTTASKIFSGAPAAFGAPPNTHVDPVTLGLPGVLPVLNRAAVEAAVRVALGFGCTVHRTSVFARKHYFYPDLPKGYQVSQYEEPLATGGEVWAMLDGSERRFRLHRIHLEEDAGKTVHDPRRDCSRVDFNRAGVPLIETVSEPDMRSSAEAVAYMKALYETVVALGVCDGNLEQGSFRCDANVSVRRCGEERLGTKVELKNINSFRFVGRAIEHEIARQTALVESGGRVVEETRLWDEEQGVTRTMRTKEEAHDYRYFPDPDLPLLRIPQELIDRFISELPELPRQKRARYRSELGLGAYDAEQLTASPARSAYFERVVALSGDPKRAANWIQGELSALLNRDGVPIEHSPISAESLAEFLGLLDAGKLHGGQARQCFQAMAVEGTSPTAWAEAHGGRLSMEAIDALCQEVALAHPTEIQSYLGGKQKVLAFLVGKVMRLSRGKADPTLVQEQMKQALEKHRP
jgi:aspartyl-tRNA(Asn)/glutamyl-tRNA(Gln) amidotransferase subunit B